MADQKISELTALTGANVADDDAIAIVDTSATETKKIVFSELKNALDTATGFVRITGDTMTGNLSMGDNVKATFGAGSDLQIYHDGSNSYIKDTATGNLNISGNDIQILNAASNEAMAYFAQDGDVTLYHNGVAKLATKSTGVDIVGTLTSDGLTNSGTSQFDASISLGVAGASNGFINSPSGIFVNIDSDNNQTDRFFDIRRNSTDGSGPLIFKAEESGDISFYEDTGTTPKLFWDASAESLGIGTSSPSGKLSISGATATNEQVHTTFTNTSGAKTFAIGAGQSGVTNNGFVIRNVTDNTFPLVISDAGVTSFDGSVGIGTSSPSSYYANHLVVDTGSSAQSGITIVSDTNNQGMFAFADGTSGDQRYRGAIDYNHSNDSMAFLAAGSEAMRLQSGNLLVGKTSSSFSTEGSQLNSNGSVDITKSGGAALFVNRLSSDGDIAKFYKDGATVGSIRAVGTQIAYSAQSEGLLGIGSFNYYRWNTSEFEPVSSGNRDLGSSTYKWKDLYLSGGVLLGGTGSANKLDYYEEGTWTPTISSGTVTAENAWYVRVGTLITISGKFSGFSDTSSGNTVTVGGVPFTTKASDHTAQGSMIADYLSNGPYFPYISSNATTIRFYIQSTTNYTTMAHSNLGSSGSFYFTLTYQTQ